MHRARQKKTSTLFTAHKGYVDDWAAILDGILDGTSQLSHQDVLQASRAAGITPDCNIPTADEAYEMHFSDDDDNRIDGFGISADTDATDKISAGCPYRLEINASSPSIECSGNWCEGSPYVKMANLFQLPKFLARSKLSLTRMNFRMCESIVERTTPQQTPKSLALIILDLQQILRFTAFAQMQRPGSAFAGIDSLTSRNSTRFSRLFRTTNAPQQNCICKTESLTFIKCKSAKRARICTAGLMKAT